MALILDRKPGGKLCVITPTGEYVWITVAAVNSARRVRLEIDAPPNVKVWREEVVTAMQRSTEAGR